MSDTDRPAPKRRRSDHVRLFDDGWAGIIKTAFLYGPGTAIAFVLLWMLYAGIPHMVHQIQSGYDRDRQELKGTVELLSRNFDSSIERMAISSERDRVMVQENRQKILTTLDTVREALRVVNEDQRMMRSLLEQHDKLERKVDKAAKSGEG